MELARLIEVLSDPRVYPGGARNVVVHQTHISVVFIAESTVYKIKKPVDLGFLDYSTLEKRRHWCEEEVRLNRRLALACTRVWSRSPETAVRSGSRNRPRDRMGGEDGEASRGGDARKNGPRVAA